MCQNSPNRIFKFPSKQGLNALYDLQKISEEAPSGMQSGFSKLSFKQHKRDVDKNNVPLKAWVGKSCPA